jgi:large subunit ribosomal protein L7/L12
LEAAELVKQIETTFGVDASAPVGGAVMMAGPAAAAEEAEVQTEFKLIILDCAADKRIAAIKVVRGLTTLGLKEAKDAVTALPFTILDGKPKADVEKAKKELEEAGASTRQCPVPSRSTLTPSPPLLGCKCEIK